MFLVLTERKAGSSSGNENASGIEKNILPATSNGPFPLNAFCVNTTKSKRKSASYIQITISQNSRLENPTGILVCSNVSDLFISMKLESKIVR